MNNAPRVPLSDLITEYFLHDDRKDFYLEGRDDCAILSWYLEPVLTQRMCVRDIDAIEIEPAELAKHGFDDGNKNRVLVLAIELDAELPKDSDQVLCIVDADFDYLLGSIINNRFLAYTDDSSMEMYGFSEQLLERILRLVIQDFYAKARDILNALSVVLKEIFLIRAANHFLRWGLAWLPFERRCHVRTDGSVVFDYDKFVQDYLSNNGRFHQLKAFKKCVVLLEKKCVGTRTKWVRGHDFSVLLTHYLKSLTENKTVREIMKGEVAGRLLFLGLERKELKTMSLFRRIDNFIS